MNWRLLILLMLLPSVIATEKIFDDWVYNLDTFKEDGDIFYAVLSSDEEAVMLYHNDEPHFVPLYGCDETQFYLYCFNDSELDYNDYGRQIPNTLDWEPALHIRIWNKIPEVDITREVDTPIDIDQKSNVRITIKNEGELILKNLHFSEPIPENAQIQFLGDDLVSDGETVTYTKAAISPDKSLYTNYVLIPTGGDILLPETKLYFTYEGKEFYESVPKKTIKLNKEYNLDIKFNKKTMIVEDVFTFTIKLKNTENDDRVTGTIAYRIPDEIDIVKFPSIAGRGRDIEYDFDISPDEEDVIEYQLEGKKMGEYSIPILINIKKGSEEYVISRKMNISMTRPLPEFTLKVEPKSVYEGRAFVVTVDIDNPSGDSSIYLTGTLTGPFDTVNLNKSRIEEDKSTIVEDGFDGLPVNSEKTYPIILKGYYSATNGERFSFQKESQITIKPVQVGFSVDKTGSKSVKPGDNVTIKVSIKNVGQKISVAEAKEVIPEGFEVISGLTKKDLTLDLDQKEEFYEYKLRVPEFIEGGDYDVITVVTGDAYINKTLTIKVDAPIVEDDVPITKPDFDTETEEIEEKKGVIAKVIDWFKNLFS